MEEKEKEKRLKDTAEVLDLASKYVSMFNAEESKFSKSFADWAALLREYAACENKNVAVVQHLELCSRVTEELLWLQKNKAKDSFFRKFFLLAIRIMLEEMI